MEQLANPENSNLFEQFEFALPEFSSLISRTIFSNALTQAGSILDENLNLEEDKIKDSSYASEFLIKQEKQGLTGESRLLKAGILNYLYNRLVSFARLTRKKIIDFANNTIVKPARRFFTFLNSVLNSFVKIIPGVEPMIEIKEIMEAFLGSADDIN